MEKMLANISNELDNAFETGDKEAAGLKKDELLTLAARFLSERNYPKLQSLHKELAFIEYLYRDKIKDVPSAKTLGAIEAMAVVARILGKNTLPAEVTAVLEKSSYSPKIISRLKENGQMRHNRLAASVGISPAQLNRTLKTIWSSEALTSTDYGKYRYYSLTNLGEVAYETAQKSPTAELTGNILSALRELAQTKLIDRQVIDKVAKRHKLQISLVEELVAILEPLKVEERAKTSKISASWIENIKSEMREAPRLIEQRESIHNKILKATRRSIATLEKETKR